MWRCIFRWIAPVLVAGSCFLPVARAQNQPQDATKTTADETPPVRAAPQYFVAFLCTIVVLVMVCYPSRKS